MVHQARPLGVLIQYFEVYFVTELHITPRSDVNKELADFYHHIKFELATILILRHSQK